jgi:glycosyltransferase involved in cell wall biosynthesis
MMTKKCNKKIFFIGHDFKFLNEYISYLELQKNLEISKFQLEGHEFVVKPDFAEQLENVDIVFCEWALGNVRALSKLKNKKFRLIVRVHAQEFRELREKTVNSIEWENVDDVIFISPFLKSVSESLLPQIMKKAVYIPNYVALEKYKSSESDKSRSFSLGLVGMLPPLKRVDKALELIGRLHATDSRYTLTIKSQTLENLHWARKNAFWRQWYDETFNRFEHLIKDNVVKLESFSNEISDFYCSVDYILSMSDTEGSHQAVAEGMFSGCIPIIRDWPGAKAIYKHNVFENLDEMVAKIIHIERSGTFESSSNQCRSFVRKRFSQSAVFPQLDRCLGLSEFLL